MDGFPTAVRESFTRFAAPRRHLAWIELDNAERIQTLGGDLAHHALEHLAMGDDLTDALPAAGALAEHELLRVELRPGHFVDLVMRRTERGWLLLVLDSVGLMSRERELLQRGNELSLAREALEARVERSTQWSELLASLGIALLERGPRGQLNVPEASPAWLAVLCGAARAKDASLGDVDEMTFLGNFLIDARRFWERGTAGHMRSGPWTESFQAKEMAFEAIAVNTATGTSWLVIEALSGEHDEHLRLLQRARETRLDYDELREEVEKKEVLLHCIVHDLKGPLASIVGVLSMLLRRDPPSERRNELLELALRQARRQDEHIQAVLEVFAAEVASIESWERDPGQAPDLLDVATAEVTRWTPAFEEAGRRLVLASTVQERLVVAADRDHLERVLSNLLENARRHAPAGSTVEVEVGAAPPAAFVRVIDHGPGVDPVLVPDLFRRFARGRGGGSSGLGLYFCRRTLERWGGRARYAPTPGGGATFVIELMLL